MPFHSPDNLVKASKTLADIFTTARMQISFIGLQPGENNLSFMITPKRMTLDFSPFELKQLKAAFSEAGFSIVADEGASVITGPYLSVRHFDIDLEGGPQRSVVLGMVRAEQLEACRDPLIEALKSRFPANSNG